MSRYIKKFLKGTFRIDFKRIKSFVIQKKLIPVAIKFIKNYPRVRLTKLIYRRQDNKNLLMINIGGGVFFRKHWQVLDIQSWHYGSPSYYIDYNFDLTSGKPLPFKDNSVKFFYSSHTLEHIPQEHCQHIFNEFYRCLQKGGGIRLTMPDFDKAYEAYGNNYEEYFKKDYPGDNITERFLDYFATYLKKKVSIEEFKKNYKSMKKEEFADYYISEIPRESQIKQTGNHINWWNFEKLKKMLIRARFSNIYRSAPHKSRFPEMRSRCSKGRKDGFDRTLHKYSIFIEVINE